eukprot:13887265-Alexandrium_andersonii.AAC.1
MAARSRLDWNRRRARAGVAGWPRCSRATRASRSRKWRRAARSRARSMALGAPVDLAAARAARRTWLRAPASLRAL